MFRPGWLDPDLNVRAKCAHEVEKPLKGKSFESALEKLGNIRLAKADFGRGLALCEILRFNHLADEHHEMGFHIMLLK